MSTETLYHAEIALPAGFRAPTHTVKVTYSSHAKREAAKDRYGMIFLPPTLNLSEFEVIEVGVTDGKVSKVLFRGMLDDERDMCIVLIPGRGAPWHAKTVWINERNDLHRTLDRTRYAAA